MHTYKNKRYSLNIFALNLCSKPATVKEGFCRLQPAEPQIPSISKSCLRDGTLLMEWPLLCLQTTGRFNLIWVNLGKVLKLLKAALIYNIQGKFASTAEFQDIIISVVCICPDLFATCCQDSLSKKRCIKM